MTERPVPAAANGAARRHRVEGGRPHAVKIRFTDAEYEAVAAHAADAGVSVQRYLTDRAFTGRSSPVRAPAALVAELSGLRRLTGSLANNMNQIARWLNSGGRPDARVTAAMDSVRRAMTRLDSALNWLGATQKDELRPRAGQAESPSARPDRIRQDGTGVPARRNADPRARA